LIGICFFTAGATIAVQGRSYKKKELFLAGQRIEQFHDPQRDAEPYWEEVLRRDPGDSAAHTGLGRLDLERARFDSAEQHFLKALDRLMIDRNLLF